MRRMQIQIDDSTYDALREYASRQGRSVTVVVRELVAKHAPGRARTVKGKVKTPPGPHTTLPTKPLPRRVEDFKLFGCFASGRPEDRVSERHDEILGEGRW